MPFQQADGLRYYTFDSLSEQGLSHAVFTRHGGVSPAPWSSLNMGGTVGDDRERVAENRRRAFGAVNRSPDSFYDVWLVHSADVAIARKPRAPGDALHKVDAILTDQPQVTLLMRFADCVPILLFDPLRRVAGIAHAGWQGTVKRVAAAAVEAMHAEYGSMPRDIYAAIGPSIGPDHYPVGDEVIEPAQASFGQDASALLPESNGAVNFDLWAANRLVLERAGVRYIEEAGLCTACHNRDWFSHRGEGGKTGRFGVLMWLNGRA